MTCLNVLRSLRHATRNADLWTWSWWNTKIAGIFSKTPLQKRQHLELESTDKQYFWTGSLTMSASPVESLTRKLCAPVDVGGLPQSRPPLNHWVSRFSNIMNHVQKYSEQSAGNIREQGSVQGACPGYQERCSLSSGRRWNCATDTRSPLAHSTRSY